MKSDREEFPRHVKEQAWLRSKGHCEMCGAALAGRRPEYHHRIAAALYGRGDLENCVVACPPCHRTVTKDKDVPRISKAKRVEADRAGLRPRRSAFREKRDFINKIRAAERAEEREYDRDT